MANKSSAGTSLRFGKGIGLGFFEEFVLKKLEAESRLARTFAAFIKIPDGGYFIYGGNVLPTNFSNKNFGSIIIGHSLVEINQGEDLLWKIGSRISQVFTENDFHSTVAMDFLSKYLRANIQNMKIPQALAVEFMFIDSVDNLFRVHFTGDVEMDGLDETDEDVFVIGCYDPKFRKRLLAELKKVPKKLDPDQMKAFAEALKKKFDLPCCGLIA